jgi:molybdopterin molybdotransferase
MKERFIRKSSERRMIIPVVITSEGSISPVDYHGSAHISAFSVADGIISIPAGKKVLKKGETVSVRQI